MLSLLLRHSRSAFVGNPFVNLTFFKKTKLECCMDTRQTHSGMTETFSQHRYLKNRSNFNCQANRLIHWFNPLLEYVNSLAAVARLLAIA